MSDEIEETAKAAQEIAKAAGQGLRVIEKTGGFIAKHIDASLTAAFGMLADRLQFTRDVRRARLFKRFEEEMLALGSQPNVKPLPLGFAIDAIEQGSIEEVDELQDMWARLLANAADASTAVEARRSHISILKDFTTLDALVFERLYAFDPPPQPEMIVLTTGLPAQAQLVPRISHTSQAPPPDAVRTSLANLSRLGLLIFEHTMDGLELHAYVNQTFAGEQLMRAIRRRHM